MRQSPSDKLEHWDIDRLIPYAKNSRTHSPEQVAQIAASIKEWGFTSAVLVDEQGGIIAGHGRVQAARKLGMETVPVMVATGWTDAQKRAYIIADNKLALNSGWDMDMLRLELGELDAAGFDLELTGFVGDDLTEAMFGKELNMDPEEFNGDADNKFQLLIEFNSEQELSLAFEDTKTKGLKCKIIQ